MDDNSVLVKRKPITFEHDVTIYVPVFQKDFKENGELEGYPTFSYSYEMASNDELMVASMEPDYILELTGKFKATTKPFTIKGEE